MPTGGSIESVSIASRIFAVASDADSNRKLGGFENETQPNGNGSIRQVKTRVAWAISDLNISVDDMRGDHEYLQNLSDTSAEFAVVVTYASGASYQGSGQINGELQVASQATTATLSLMGSGTLTRQL